MNVEVNVKSGISITLGTQGLPTYAYVESTYYRKDNPSGFITGNGNLNTGSLTGAFYPLTGNPSSFIIPSQTGVLADQTYVNITSGSLNNKINSTGSLLLALISASSGAIPSINNVSGILTLTGAGNVLISIAGKTFTISGDTGAYVNFVTTGQTGNFVATGSNGTINCSSLNATAGSIVTSNNIGVGAGGSNFWSTKSQIQSPTNGTFLLTNASSNGWTRLIFGTNTPTGLSFGTSGNTISALLGDGSGPADFSCNSVFSSGSGNFVSGLVVGGVLVVTSNQTGNFVATGSAQTVTAVGFTASSAGTLSQLSNGGINFSAGNIISWSTRSRLSSPSDGTFLVTNSSQNGFNRLIFGTNTSSGLSFGTSGNTISAQLGDGSGPANFSCSGLGVSGTINSPSSNNQAISLGTSNSLGTDGTQIYNYNVGGAKKTFSLYGNNSGPTIASDLPFSWSSSTDATLTADLTFYRDAANIFAQRNGVNGQASRIYGNFTNPSTGTWIEINAGTGANSISLVSSGFTLTPLQIGLNRSGIIYVANNSGLKVGINNPNPRYTFDVGGDIFVSGNVYSDTPLSFINSGITGMVQSGTSTSINNTLNIGAFGLNANPGQVTLMEVPVVSGSGISGVEQSYGFNIAGNTLLKVYTEHDGRSGVQNTQLVLGASGQDSAIHIFAGANASAPTGSGSFNLPVAEAIFGGTNAFLGTPVGWWGVKISGQNFRIPYYN